MANMYKQQKPPRSTDIIRSLPPEIWNIERKDRSKRKKADPAGGDKRDEEKPAPAPKTDGN